MGMFDDVLCEAPLPRYKHLQDEVFQTKSFDMPEMGKYRITADGRLLHQFGYYHDPAEREDWHEMPDYHGVVEFYKLEPGVFPPVMRTFWARFTEGKLSRIMLWDGRLCTITPKS